MQQIASDLFLLTTNLSQIKNRNRLIQLFLKSIHTIFAGHSFDWLPENDQYTHLHTLAVCTQRNKYGYILYDKSLTDNAEGFALFQNTAQILAFLIERLEQDELLLNQKAHLQQLVDNQTNDLIKKQNELNEMNEEFATMNEELIDTNQSLIRLNEQLRNEIEERKRNEEQLRTSDKIFLHSIDMLCIAGFDGYFKVLNPAWSKTLGWSTKELLSKPWIEFVHPDDIINTNFVKSTIIDGRETYLFENRYICKDGSIKWLSWNSFPYPEEGIMFGVARDVTKLKESELNLKRIKWMLNPDREKFNIENKLPEYGDLTKLNITGLITHSIDQHTLADIANDYLGLLETSSAIYEKNGNYALGIFSSGWCRFMDESSRKLCRTKNNESALQSGKWLCHESCWTEASKKAIETGETVDIPCSGGLNLYVAPIFANNEIVGAINFGYGNPPTDEDELRKLAEKYEVDFRELTRLAKAYESRPPFIVNLAKNRLHSSARQIGVLIERKQALEALKESEEKFRNIVQSSPNGIYFYKLNANNQLIFSGTNPSADRIIGFDHSQLAGQTIQDAFPNLANTFVPELYTKIAKCEAPTSTFEIEYDDEKANGHFEVTVYFTGNMTIAVEFIDITKRKKAEIILKESEEKYRALIQFAPDAFFQGDNEGNFITINDKACELTGYSKEELQSKNMSFLFTEAEHNKKPLRYDLLLKGETLTNERNLMRKDGQSILIEMTSKMLPDGSFQSFIRDITERKKTEMLLRESERLLAESQRVSAIGSYTLDIVNGIWSGSTVLNEMFELDPSDDHSIAGWLAVIHPDDREMMANYFSNEVIGKKGRFDKIYRIAPLKSKKSHWIHGIGELEFDENGNPIRMVGTIQDITYRVNAEEKLRILTRAIDQSPDSIVITNTKAEIEYVNPVIEKLSGYTKEELIGKNPRIFSSGKTPKEEYKILWDTITSGKSWQGEFQNKKKNGELYWESATISPVLNNDGKITHYLAIREDITLQKKMTEDLIEAKEHAEESDRLKTSFLANMSHEIRTPMNSIMGFASLLPDEESKELMCNYANIIVRSSEQLVHIIDDIVLYSRLQTKLLSYRPTTFDALSLLSDIKQSFNLPDFKKGVELLIETNTTESTPIYTDYEKIRQVFTNLISNSFKYTPSGSITIGFEMQNNQLTFFVKDTGMGIPEKEKEKIFDRFYRASNVNKGAIGGTGLGLSIVKELIELLAGEIWVESDEGKGSVFFFTVLNNQSN
jgi:PAS domain S-box-containing protein